MTEDRTYSTTEAAKILGCSDRNVRRACERGEVGCMAAGDYRLTAQEIDGFVVRPRGNPNFQDPETNTRSYWDGPLPEHMKEDDVMIGRKKGGE